MVRSAIVTFILVAALGNGCAAPAPLERRTSSAGPLATSPARTAAPQTPEYTVEPNPTNSATALAPAATISATSAPLDSDASGPFSIDLYREGAFVSQGTRYYCVPASEQVMTNLIKGTADITRATQDRLYEQTRSYLITPYIGLGGQPEGWVQVLTDEGDGPYEVAILGSFEEAVQLAARRLLLTGRPVGLLVWHGLHAWVMSGFTSRSKPTGSGEVAIEGLFVEDVWWPRTSATWGRSDPPDTFLPTAELADNFLPYAQRGEGGLDKDGQFVLIAPVVPSGTDREAR